MSFDAILRRLDRVTGSGAQRSARCPAHDDNRASLSVKEEDDGRTLLKCHAGCDAEAIVRQLGLQMADLMPKNGHRERKEVAIYDYRDESRTRLFQAVRFEPKDFRQRRPDGSGGWHWDLKGTRRVLYCLPELLAADPEEPVFIVEGEKDVDRLRRERLVATCNPMGAGKWSDAFNEPLRGRWCVVIPDNDKPGSDHAGAVVRSVRGVAKKVTRLDLDGLPKSGDVSDWLNAGHTAMELLQQATLAPEALTTEGSATAAGAESSGSPDRFRIVGADEFVSMRFPPREYLLPPLIEEKTLGMLYAWRGTGKTIVATGIALAITSGGGFLRWQGPSKPRRVLYVDGELPQETLQRRIHDVSRSCGLEVSSRLRLLTPDLQPDGLYIPNLADPGGQRAFLGLIEAENPDLTIWDNISTLCRAGEENSAEAWQPAQDFLVLLRSRRRSSLILHHTGKGGDQRGTSKREDVLDYSIKLERPSDYRDEDGARFKVTFPKCRDLRGDAVQPFEARLEGGLEGSVWTLKDASQANDERIAEMLQSGMKPAAIAAELGVHPSTVYRTKKRSAAGGER